MLTTQKREDGYIMILVLAFMGIFLTILGGLSSYVILENKQASIEVAREQAFYIAEAGLNYYKWHLAHFPDDFHDGEGATSTGPYLHDYDDPESGVFGNYSLTLSGNRACDETTSVDITSTGRSDAFPSYERIVHAKYAKPSVAEYAFIFNAPVWFGSNEVIKGPVHSNAGIRMDGESHSIVESAVETWYCTQNLDCNPEGNKPGIFGSGIDSSLWEFPVPQIDFTGISVDLSNMRQEAEDNGVYFGPSGDEGYHVVFKNNGTFDIYRVTKTQRVWAYDSAGDRIRDENNILNQSYLGNYSLPSSCSLIFVDDKLWVDGTVSGKVTIASADVDNPNRETDVILPNNIIYKDADGSDGLTVVSEGSILIPLDAPDDLELDGIFIAQTGNFGLYYYQGHSTDAIKDNLKIFGTIVSNDQPVTTWVNGSGDVISGYKNETDSFNQSLIADPPPLTPNVSDKYQFITWDEEPIE